MHSPTLIHPVPDEAALHRPFLAKALPILVQAAVTVAHRVTVLAEDDGPRIRVVTPLPGVRLLASIGVLTAK